MRQNLREKDRHVLTAVPWTQRSVASIFYVDQLQKLCFSKGQTDQEAEVGEETLSEDERLERQDLNSLVVSFCLV